MQVIYVSQTVDNLVFRSEEYLKVQGVVVILCTPWYRLLSVMKKTVSFKIGNVNSYIYRKKSRFPFLLQCPRTKKHQNWRIFTEKVGKKFGYGNREKAQFQYWTKFNGVKHTLLKNCAFCYDLMT